MSTHPETCDAIVAALNTKIGSRSFTTRAMFGEYALYLNKKVVGLICDDLLYVKVRDESQPLSEICEVGEPYPGAKPHYLIPDEDISRTDELIPTLITIADSREGEKKSKTHKESMSHFASKVVAAAQEIPKGKVSTYGRISKAAGGTAPRQAQSVTSILGKAYEQGITDIPFHRIVFADGRAWTDNTHKEERIKKLHAEGIELDPKGRVVNFIDHLHEF